MDTEEERLRRIRDRAYVISQGHDAGTAEENWLRAEREIGEEYADALRREAAERGHGVAMRTAYTHP